MINDNSLVGMAFEDNHQVLKDACRYDGVMDWEDYDHEMEHFEEYRTECDRQAAILEVYASEVQRFT